MNQPRQNLQVQVRSLPQTDMSEANFQLNTAAVPQPDEGQVLTRTDYLSIDPYMRKRMADALAGRWQLAPGDVLMGRSVGEVLASRHAGFAPGDVVLGWGGWQQYAVEQGASLEKVDSALPRSLHLGVLGRPGITAWLGMVHVGRVQRGETVLVSSAAGAVGSIAGQIASLSGARAVGIAGSDDKCRTLVESLRFEAGVNYRSARFQEELASATPDGVDLCFENVGAQVFDAALDRMREGGRIALCGLVGHYHSGAAHAFQNFERLLDRGLKLQGFRIDAHRDLAGPARAALGRWWSAGQVKPLETVTDGLENAPRAFAAMLAGRGSGKHLVKVR